MNNYNDGITIAIKTFIRKKSLWTLLKSIERFYPELPIIIVDDSPIKYKASTLKNFPQLKINYINAPFDIGLSKGRNLILDNIKTKYFLLCDDDFELNSKTDLFENVRSLKENNIDILGGDIIECFRFNSIWSLVRWARNRIFRRDDVLTSDKIYNRCEIVDSTMIIRLFKSEDNDLIRNLFTIDNFFLGKTESIKKIGGWHPDTMKIYEHGLFFVNAFFANLNVASTANLKCNSVRYMPIVYMAFRLRPNKKYIRIIDTYLKKKYIQHNITSIRRIGIDGELINELEA